MPSSAIQPTNIGSEEFNQRVAKSKWFGPIGRFAAFGSLWLRAGETPALPLRHRLIIIAPLQRHHLAWLGVASRGSDQRRITVLLRNIDPRAMSGKVLTIVAAVLVGAAGGFMAGRMSSSQSDRDPKLGDEWPSKSNRPTTPRSRLPLPDYGLALGDDVETTLKLYDASVPGEVNWPLVDAMRDALYQPLSAD